MTPRITIRIARAKDGAAICGLVGGDFWKGLEALDWETVAGGWLVAECDNKVIGCVTPIPSKPIGHIEHMGLDALLSDIQLGRVVSMLMNQSFAMLKQAGCDAVMTTVPMGLSSYVEVLENRGGKVLHRANVMIKRLV